jgi:predicted dienelactone hydrolase
VWYPATIRDEPLANYEVLPGVAFSSAGAHDNPAPLAGSFPLILFSHGRTGMRHSYSLLCEALAARGAVVVSPDHPGDGLFDWAFGNAVDDRTNEINRAADGRFVLDRMLDRRGSLGHLAANIDPDQIVIAGHSYGVFTGFAAAAGSRGVEPDPRVRAVIGLQSYTRIMSDTMLQRVATPLLLIVGDQDVTTPPTTDADRVFALVSSTTTWRADIAGAAHQAASDMGLYAELACHIEGLPQIVVDYLAISAPDATGPNLRPYRENLLLQLQAIWAFLDIELGVDPSRGEHNIAALAATPGVTIVRAP